MKRNVYLMLLLLAGAVAVFFIAACLTGREKENVVIVQETVYGDPEAAKGLTLEWKTQWAGQLLWDTQYTVGSGEEAKSGFVFRSGGSRWKNFYEGEVLLETNGGWGELYISADHMEETICPELTKAVASRTENGSTHTETIRFADYYEYYPLDFSVAEPDSGLAHFYNRDQAYWADFFRIPVPEDHLMEVTVTKDMEGSGLSVNCASIGGGIRAIVSEAFGKQDCYFTFYCESEEGAVVNPEGAYRIFYMPDFKKENLAEESISGKSVSGEGTPGENTVVEVACELEKGLIPIGLCRDEERGLLYLTALEGDAVLLYVYRLEGEKPVAAQKLEVCKMEGVGKEVYWRGLFPTEKGLLMVWSDAGFVFVEERDGRYAVFCEGQFPAAEPAEGAEKDEAYHFESVFVKENAICFDGERLALAAYTSWEDVDVCLAVYGRDGMRYHGIYYNSGGIDSRNGAMNMRIRPWGNRQRGQRRAEEALKCYVRGQQGTVTK